MLVLNKLIFANLTHRPVRTLLSVLAIAVEVTMILTLVGVSHGTLDSTKNRARGGGCGRHGAAFGVVGDVEPERRADERQVS